MTIRVDVAPGAISFDPRLVVVAGFTGRDAASVRAHIEELEAQGISSPAETPTFVLVSPDNLAVGPTTISVVTAETSGEAEAVLLRVGGRLFVTVGSDHTDRGLERLDLAGSKRVCPKVIGRAAWPVDSVADRWDALMLRGFTRSQAGERTLVQESPLARLLPFSVILEKLATRFDLGESDLVVFTGTIPAVGPLGGDIVEFSASLTDDAGGRTLDCTYGVEVVTLESRGEG